MIACVVLSGLFAAQVVKTPLYSERDKSPDNPGGFSTSIMSAIGVFIVETCLLIPAFPVLIVLASLPPDGLPARARPLLLAACFLYVGVLGTLIFRKNTDYQEDYKQSRRQELIQREQWKQHNFDGAYPPLAYCVHDKR